ncbi:hypothetical protein QOT17_011317 [Balamuthia mandrillaris]
MTEFRLECQSIKPNIGLDERECHECGDILSKLSADQWVLATKSFNYKHNVLGKRREMLKDLFEVLAKNFLLFNELTCKELRNLGFRVPHIPEMLHLTRISPGVRGQSKWPDADQQVQILLEDLERVIQMLNRDCMRLDKSNIAPDVKDFLECTIRNHKEMAKKLRCHLEEKRSGGMGRSSMGGSSMGRSGMMEGGRHSGSYY